MDSRTTATVNRDELRLTPSKRDIFQSVARSVVETTVSLPSCQQAQSIGSQCRPSQTNPSAKRRRTSQISPSPEIQHATRGDSTDDVYTTPKPCTFIATRVQQHQPSVPEPRVATESRSRQKRHVSYANTAATTAAQRHVRADGLNLRGRPTPSPQ